MKYESFQKAAYSIARKQSGGSYMIDLIASTVEVTFLARERENA